MLHQLQSLNAEEKLVANNSSLPLHSLLPPPAFLHRLILTFLHSASPSIFTSSPLQPILSLLTPYLSGGSGGDLGNRLNGGGGDRREKEGSKELDRTRRKGQGRDLTGREQSSGIIFSRGFLLATYRKLIPFTVSWRRVSGRRAE
eukprot:768629-Hanusia_phi.AAC.10